MVITDKVLIRSGRQPPGYKLETLSWVNVEGLSSVIYQGKFRVLYYDVDSGEKAVVNTEIYGVSPQGRADELATEERDDRLCFSSTAFRN